MQPARPFVIVGAIMDIGAVDQASLRARGVPQATWKSDIAEIAGYPAIDWSYNIDGTHGQCGTTVAISPTQSVEVEALIVDLGSTGDPALRLDPYYSHPCDVTEPLAEALMRNMATAR